MDACSKPWRLLIGDPNWAGQSPIGIGDGPCSGVLASELSIGRPDVRYAPSAPRK